MKPLEILILDLYQRQIANKEMPLKCINPISKKKIICDYNTAVKNRYDFLYLANNNLTFDDILTIIRINNRLSV